jgi:hypothetical protein
MSKALVKTVSSSVTKAGFSESLQSWTPASKSDSVKMLHFISLITKFSGDLKKRCYHYLEDKYPEASNAIDAPSGLEVTRVTPETKVYKTSTVTETLEAAIEVKAKELKDLQEKLKEAYIANGVDYTVSGDTYYKTK